VSAAVFGRVSPTNDIYSYAKGTLLIWQNNLTQMAKQPYSYGKIALIRAPVPFCQNLELLAAGLLQFQQLHRRASPVRRRPVHAKFTRAQTTRTRTHATTRNITRAPAHASKPSRAHGLTCTLPPHTHTHRGLGGTSRVLSRAPSGPISPPSPLGLAPNSSIPECGMCVPACIVERACACVYVRVHTMASLIHPTRTGPSASRERNAAVSAACTHRC